MLNAVVTDLLVPQRINENIFVAHLRSHVDEPHLIVVVAALVHPKYPAPCVPARLVFGLCFVAWPNHVVGHGSLNNGLQRVARSNGAPRRAPRQRDGSVFAPDAVVLAGLRIGHVIALTGFIFGEAATGIVFRSRFGDEQPRVGLAVRYAVKAGEGVAHAEGRLVCQSCVWAIFLFVAGLGTLPPRHGLYLRREERARFVRHIEATCLAADNGTAWRSAFRAKQGVAIGHIVVRNIERDLQRKTFRVHHVKRQLIGPITDVCTLRACHVIGHLNVLLGGLDELHTLREVAIVRRQSECRGSEHFHPIVTNRVRRAPTLVVDGQH